MKYKRQLIALMLMLTVKTNAPQAYNLILEFSEPLPQGIMATKEIGPVLLERSEVDSLVNSDLSRKQISVTLINGLAGYYREHIDPLLQRIIVPCKLDNDPALRQRINSFLINDDSVSHFCVTSKARLMNDKDLIVPYRSGLELLRTVFEIGREYATVYVGWRDHAGHVDDISFVLPRSVPALLIECYLGLQHDKFFTVEELQITDSTKLTNLSFHGVEMSARMFGNGTFGGFVKDMKFLKRMQAKLGLQTSVDTRLCILAALGGLYEPSYRVSQSGDRYAIDFLYRNCAYAHVYFLSEATGWYTREHLKPKSSIRDLDLDETLVSCITEFQLLDRNVQFNYPVSHWGRIPYLTNLPLDSNQSFTDRPDVTLEDRYNGLNLISAVHKWQNTTSK